MAFMVTGELTDLNCTFAKPDPPSPPPITLLWSLYSCKLPPLVVLFIVLLIVLFILLFMVPLLCLLLLETFPLRKSPAVKTAIPNICTTPIPLRSGNAVVVEVVVVVGGGGGGVVVAGGGGGGVVGGGGGGGGVVGGGGGQVVVCMSNIDNSIHTYIDFISIYDIFLLYI
jgi:uncharacterized membrane protein YgcG